jgi:hypothetical protein
MVAVTALAAVRGTARVAAAPPLVPVPRAAQPAVSTNTASTAAACAVRVVACAARTVACPVARAIAPRAALFRRPHPRPRFTPNIVRTLLGCAHSRTGDGGSTGG